VSKPSLFPLPHQPGSVPFPSDEWPEASASERAPLARMAPLIDRAFDPSEHEAMGETHALLAVQGGRIVLERYGDGKSAGETLRSWSMAKSMLHAVVGMLVEEGRLSLHAPAPIPAWAGDPERERITLEHLLRMVDGIDFFEDYDPGTGRSDVIDMLFKDGKEDVAGFAEARPLAHEPDVCWNYSSGTSNIVSAIAGRAIGDGRDDTLAFLEQRLFAPIGMTSATPRFDAAGNWIASSYVFCTARDFARFGLLYLRDGVWDGRRILPEGWVDHARTTTPASEGEYGAHWWLRLVSEDSFHCSGFQGQYILCVPSKDLVLVRLGDTPQNRRDNVRAWLSELVDGFPPA
jgi:CubicO group peptidase (beta-lactamase class C family)